MKNVFMVLSLLCWLVSSNAQNHVFVWHNDGTIDVSRFGKSDSITFSARIDTVTFTTGEPTEITHSTMTASYESKGLAFRGTATERGVCYSPSINWDPTASDLRVVDGEYSNGKWTATIEQLDSGWYYTYRPYAIIGDKTYYGPLGRFRTNGSLPYATLAHPQYVDLGLSVYWASFNVGATKPEEPGFYYARGETREKKVYSKENHAPKMTPDGRFTRGADAAAVVLGSCRMPTESEFEELINKCTWERAEVNGTEGWQVTGTTGNSIFLPICGYKDDSGLREGYQMYWSSTGGSGLPVDLFLMSFMYYTSNHVGWLGANVRSVRDK